jgi:hypothetical protein
MPKYGHRHAPPRVKYGPGAVAGTCRLYRMLLLCVPPVIATVPYMCGTGTLIVAGLQSFLTDPIVNLFF